MKSLQNKVAMITGAAEGIGRASATMFAERGARVVAVDINAELGQACVRDLVAAGHEAIFVEADVSKRAHVEYSVAEAVRQFGRIDCTFNNAAIKTDFATTVECTEENWDRGINVNLKGVWLCMKYQIAQMLAQGTGGSIVNNASVLAVIAICGWPVYNAAKAGVASLTRTAAVEFAEQAIRVNCLLTATFDTPMTRRIARNVESHTMTFMTPPMNRIAAPEECGEAAVWLCSDASSFVTGASLAIDGGWTAI
jgi:NAD(P)-dependent dehydrogenase (short-subunit alcohol dehydrogenase family)